MTTPSPERLELKVQRLDNDVSAIYEMIAGIEGTQRRHTNRFDELNDRLDGVNSRLDGFSTDLAGLRATLDEVLRRLEP